jgi:putative phosphoserine phosphatase / 1-acylglycerol-3-phosphate O-acyltransferase
MAQIAAIFDLDDTILRGSSGRLFLRYLRRHRLYFRFFRLRNAAPLVASYLQYRLGGPDVVRAMKSSAVVARGLSVEALWQVVDRWFEEMVIHAIAPAARERVQWHQAAGHLPVICSASSQFAVQPVAAHLEIEHAVYTDWLSENGRLTGQLREPVVYGPGKVYWMERWAAEQEVALDQSYFYSDHISDRPLLELVGSPTAVNPDPPLTLLAQKRGWPILHWAERSE